MKRAILATMLAGLMCFGLTACDLFGGSVGENTDPVAFKGEEVDAETWNAAFTGAENYCIKTVVTTPATTKEDPMSEGIMTISCFDGKKAHMTVDSGEGQAEAYLERSEEGTKLWQRSRTSEEGAKWSEWDGETYEPGDFDFSALGDYTFLKDGFANVTYSEADNGYTVSDKAGNALDEGIRGYLSAILERSPVSGSDFTVKKAVFKLGGGKFGAGVFDIAVKENAEAQTEDGTPRETAYRITQVCYDHGSVSVARPEGLPELGARENA